MRNFGQILWGTALAGWVQAADPTFADLAVLLAKGYFGRQVGPEASLQQCFMFLNSQGVTFSLFDIIDPERSVKREDVARAVGQSTLLLSGEAEVVNGRIKKPSEAETWVDYCLLNDVDLPSIWEGFVQRVAKGPLPEVAAFRRAVDADKEENHEK